jgi:hypothetical protein
MDILHHGPDNGEATGFRCEGVNVICSLPNIAKEAFHRSGAANRAVPDLWEGLKGQKMLFVFGQAA